MKIGLSKLRRCIGLVDFPGYCGWLQVSIATTYLNLVHALDSFLSLSAYYRQPMAAKDDLHVFFDLLYLSQPDSIGYS